MKVIPLRIYATGVVLLYGGSAFAQAPENNGKADFDRIWQECHELARATLMHQGRDGWAGTVNKMMSLGAQGTNAEFVGSLTTPRRNTRVNHCRRSMPTELARLILRAPSLCYGHNRH
jgi:hypothetical protein